MANVKKDHGAIAAGLEQGIKEMFNGLIDDTIADIDGPIREASVQMATAAQLGRYDLVDAVRDQMHLLVLEKKLKAYLDVDLVGIMIQMGTKALFDGAIAGLAGMKVTP